MNMNHQSPLAETNALRPLANSKGTTEDKEACASRTTSLFCLPRSPERIQGREIDGKREKAADQEDLSDHRELP